MKSGRVGAWTLALLAVLIPFTGHIGFVPALIALSLYSLLPIVRNTHTGLTQISRGMSQAATIRSGKTTRPRRRN